MRLLVFVPDQDSPGKKDVTHAFLPEARAFAKHHGAIPEEVIKRFPSGAPLDTRRAVTSMGIKATGQPPIDVLAFFCHGWRAGIQAGYLKQHALVLARLLSAHASPTAYVPIYGCDTAGDADPATADRDPGPGGDGGFADALRDACEAVGRRVTVTGHTNPGHCSYNPYARYFAPGCGGKGGHWYVEPKSALWGKWIAALKGPRNTLRYRFYWMTPAMIADELRGNAPPPLVG
jgi:hypothetical protein